MVSQETISATIASYFAANEALDVERFIAAFAPDATLYYAGPVSPVSGPQALRQVAELSLAPFSALKATINRVFFVENGAAISYTAHLTGKNGRTAISEGIDVMEINSAGQITSLRFYLDPEPLLPLLQ
jgi:steroid delta-isomerase